MPYPKNSLIRSSCGLLAYFSAGLLAVDVAFSQTTLVGEDFTYTDASLVAGANGGTGWDVTEAGWQAGNSIGAQNRFEVLAGAALYQGGGVGTYTEQNRTFSNPVVASTAGRVDVAFTLIRPETQAGRGIGIYLTNGGSNLFLIGKQVNGGVGLHADMNIGSASFAEFSSSGTQETITASITFDGSDTSIVLSDSNETLAAHTVAGALTFDGISLAGYNGGTTTNGIDDIVITETPNPDPWLDAEGSVQLRGFGGPENYTIPITNLGTTLALNISGVTATGLDAGDVSGITFPASIAPGATGDVGFTFTPSFGSTDYLFDLEISSDDDNGSSPFVVEVDISVADPAISVDTTPVDFGSFANNPGLQVRTVSVTNLGNSLPLDITGIILSGSSVFNFGAVPGSVAAGATETFDVTFDPGTRPGTFEAVLTISSNDASNNPDPQILFTASTAFPSEAPLAEFGFGSGVALDFASTDAAIGTVASDLLETDLGTRFEFGSRVTSSSSSAIGSVVGNAFGWSRREAPNTGIDLIFDAPTEALTFTLSPATGVVVDYTDLGWISLDFSAYAAIGGTTSYDFLLTVDDGKAPFVVGPVSGASAVNGEDVNTLLFDIRDLGSVSVPVTFQLKPQTTGATNGTLGQAGGYLDNIRLYATEVIPETPVLDVVSPATFSTEGLAETLSVPLLNSGLGELTITSVTTDGSGAASTIDPSIAFPPTLAPSGGVGTIDFLFTPNAGPGVYTTNLTVVSNAPASPQTVVLEITVRDPEINVPSGFAFPVQGHNPAPVSGFINVANDGESADLVISDASVAGVSAFSVQSTPGPIAPGESADIEVVFAPGTEFGRLNGVLTITSNNFDDPTTEVNLTGFSAPPGIPVASFNFDPSQVLDSTVDLDDSTGAEWVTSDLTDQATGSGALASNNQGGNNRDVSIGITGNYLNFSSNREGDAQTPIASGGNEESTWTSFSVTPDTGGGSIDFTNGVAITDTYAATEIGGVTSADWSLYYSIDGGTSWTSLGTSAGAASSSGRSGPLALTWDLTPLGVQSNPVDFILDPVSTGGTNGTASQRSIGFDNLILTASTVTPGTSGFDSWATDNSIDPNAAGDFDKDGIPELLEYALGLDPNVPDAAPGSLVNGLLSFNKGAGAVANGDIIYTIEVSSDLGQTDQWAPVAATEDGSSISYLLPSGEGRVFARLSVSFPPAP